MVVLIALISFGVYIFIAHRLTKYLFHKVGKRWLQLLVFGVLVFLPLYDLIIGYFVFQKFAREHPGIPVTETHIVESVLISGRKVSTPGNAIWGMMLVPTYEYRREDVVGIDSIAPGPLRAYVQFRHVSVNDPTCLRPRSTASNSLSDVCIGLTSTDEPVSRFEVFEEPDRGRVARYQLNESRLFRIYGSHSYVRDLIDGRLIAETWHMSYYLWWLNSPETIVFSRRNPGGYESYESLRSASNVLDR